MDEVAAERAGAIAAAEAEEREAAARRMAAARRAIEQRLGIQTQMVAKAHIKVCRWLYWLTVMMGTAAAAGPLAGTKEPPPV
jgi:hypothetical protein